MKKILAVMLGAIMILSLVACSQTKENGKETDTDANTTTQSDMEYVKEKGTLVVGITEFAPMDYKDEEGNWIGFDADMATAFAKSLGVEVEFTLIDWNGKIMELKGKTIDCVWNGMTLTDEVTSSMECSNAYCKNAQVVVVKKDVADKYPDEASLAGLTFAVEDGSAGEDEAVAREWNYTEVTDQATALMEVVGGTADATIIDWLMAKATIGEGTNYENLTYTVKLNEEEYGVGFRKGSDLAEALNKFFIEAYADGSMTKCAAKYEIDENVIPQE